jgi:hypothetical protein
VRLSRRLTFGLPRSTWMAHRLERTGLVGAPDRQTHRLAGAVGVLDQLFFDSVSGSVRITVPLTRLRVATPVGHHVRLCW